MALRHDVHFIAMDMRVESRRCISPTPSYTPPRLVILLDVRTSPALACISSGHEIAGLTKRVVHHHEQLLCLSSPPPPVVQRLVPLRGPPVQRQRRLHTIQGSPRGRDAPSDSP